MQEPATFSRPRRPDLTPWSEHQREIESVWARVSQMLSQCQLGSPEPEFLFSLSHSTSGTGAIVEIGTNIGTSLLMLAAAQRLKRTGRRVTTIDLLRNPALDANLDNTGLRDFVNLIVDRSSIVAASWTEPVELLWIDGDHSRGGCAFDIDAWSRFVVPGGLIALHDYADGMGVPLAVYDTLLARPWQYRVVSDRDYGSIIVLEKIHDEQISPWVDHMSPEDEAPPTFVDEPAPTGEGRTLLRPMVARLRSLFSGSSPH